LVQTHYNPWPLGQLPKDFQRPEPDEIKKFGYTWSDPRDIVDIFERKLAKYAGAKFAVLTDSCTNALFLSLKLRGVTGEVPIPSQTYVSVPFQIHHAGGRPLMRPIEWKGLYQLGQTGVWDSAARFTKDMFIGGDALQCLSFQIKKRLPVGRGGAILTDSKDEFEALKLMSYDGRNLSTPYTDPMHVSLLGWHSYMTPEDAARGILLMDKLPEHNLDTMDWTHYPDLRNWTVVADLEKGRTDA
jgi:dTDP-4-amino-4,6-dideoxygalactose transaminase